MSNSSEIDLERDALNIPAEARLGLAGKLLASVPSRSRPNLSEKEALDLAEQRAAELDRGDVQGLDYREQMNQIRASLTR